MQRNGQPKPIRLDTSMAIKMSVGGPMFQERALMARSDVWHMVKILKGGHYDKEVVLNAILAAVDPAELTPIKYQVTGEDSFFVARSCGAALDKLCKCNLIVKNSSGDPLILVITLAYGLIQDLKFSIKPHVSNAITKRYDTKKKSLDLTEFHRDPELFSVAYCPLTQQRAFGHVLNLVKSAFPVEKLNLQRNDLMTLTALQTSGITTINSIDLRGNILLNMNELSALKNMPITSLWLDGNPLCENYSNVGKYIESAKMYCPNLMQLDGVSLNITVPPEPSTLYAKKESREGLVRAFAGHFFKLLDQGDKTVLRGLYCNDSIYSMSSGIPGGTAHKLGLGQFTASRNLMRAQDPKKAQKQGQKQMLHIYCGENNILVAMKRLPRCYHDQTTFTYDVMYDDGKCLVLAIGGFLKKLDSPPVILSFSRTFVLNAGQDNEYKIMNDQYHVDMAPDGMDPCSIVMKISFDEFKPRCFSERERKMILKKLGDASTMNEEWCLSYLEDAKWDLRRAIKTFLEDYEALNVPQHAFTR